MGEIDILKRASDDLWTTDLILKQQSADPSKIDVAAYHLQQCVEKTMKFEMMRVGVEFEWTHEIDVLLDQMDRHGLKPPEWIYDVSALLTEYAVKTRYHTGVVANQKRVAELAEKARVYLKEQQHKQKASLVNVNIRND